VGNDREVVPTMYWFAVMCPGYLRCHSSILNFKNSPGMLRGTYEPLGSVIFPSKLRWHFPSRIYSITSGHCLIKCLTLPQKLQLVIALSLECRRSECQSCDQKCENAGDAMASEMRPRRLMRLSNLASNRAGAIGGSVLICEVSCDDDVPWRTNCAAS